MKRNVDRKLYGHKLASDFLCTKAQLLHGSEHNYYSWECLPLKCEKCFLNKPSVLLCERSAFEDPSVIMKWEKWDTMYYTRRHLVGPCLLPLDPQQQQGIPLRFAPEAPKLKKTWVKKSGPLHTISKILHFNWPSSSYTPNLTSLQVKYIGVL